MTTLARSLGLTLAALLAMSCSSTTPVDHAMADSGMEMDSGAPAADGATDAGDSGATTGKPATPQMLGAAKLSGVLHVTWKLNDTGLTSVALMRKKDAGAYAKAYSLAGTATSQHDMGATPPGTYCYQVMTTRSGVDSDLSNEICGTP